MQTVSLSLFRFGPALDRLWVLGQMGAARLSFMRMPDVGFWKLCGSGTGEGFTPIPNTAVWAILATWPDEATARTRVENEAVYRRWRNKAKESWTLYMAPTSARGAWSGVSPFMAEGDAGDGPVAALTRATVRPSVLAKFWGRVPNIEDVIGDNPDVAFKIGIGEVPWLHQVTFSIWPDVGSMNSFARESGPHAEAIRAVREGAWFKEELYARFRLLGETGSWGGESPLRNLERIAA
ncbi:MAG: spheroidene monooxygenase [Rhodobacteraceae bacterium]|nr:spheroidene monooxygenase [Paracoccaceae bacterium]